MATKKESHIIPVKRIDGELYVVTPKTEVKVFFDDEIIPEEYYKKYDIVIVARPSKDKDKELIKIIKKKNQNKYLD